MKKYCWVDAHYHVAHLLCLILTWGKQHHAQVVDHWLIAHLLCLKVIRGIFQWQWPYVHCVVAHFLCLIPIGDIWKWLWSFLNCLLAHFFGLKMIWDKSQWKWLVAHCFVPNLLRLIPIGEIYQWVYSYTHCFVISWVLRWSGVSIIKSGILSCGILLYRVIFIYIFRPGEGQIYPEMVISHQIIFKQLSVTSTTFSCLQEHTNSSHNQDARQ